MIEEPADRRLQVERHILVDDPLSKAFLRNLGGSDRTGRQDDADAIIEDALHERNDGNGFTDACRMNPDERALRTLALGNAVAFATTAPVFLALGHAPRDIRSNQRIGCGTGTPIQHQYRSGPALAHRGPSTRR